VTAPDLVPVYDERLECSLLLPDGWTVQVDPGSGRLACVAGDDLERDGFRPSVTVERHPPIDPADLPALVERSGTVMVDNYQAFAARWSRAEAADGRAPRVLRSYEFLLGNDGPLVRQLQALVAGAALFVVNCSELASVATLEDVFVAVGMSLDG
jgi:hypothetical protein